MKVFALQMNACANICHDSRTIRIVKSSPSDQKRKKKRI